MKAAELNKIYTIPDYFLLEESGEIRHEFIDGYGFLYQTRRNNTTSCSWYFTSSP
jgi:hypothetical protein